MVRAIGHLEGDYCRLMWQNVLAFQGERCEDIKNIILNLEM